MFFHTLLDLYDFSLSTAKDMTSCHARSAACISVGLGRLDMLGDPSWIWKIEIRKRIIPRFQENSKENRNSMGSCGKCAYLLPAFINLFPTPEILSSWIFAMTLCDTPTFLVANADFPGSLFRATYWVAGGGLPRQNVCFKAEVRTMGW